MATINLGAIKFNWKGAYNSGTSYAVDDVVSSGGNSYVCIQAHSNQAVGNATAYWNIMSSAGTNGTNGTDVGTTITTQGDILYRDGSGLARLPAGTSGQLLKTGGSGANPSWHTQSAGGVVQVKTAHLSTNLGITVSNNSYTQVPTGTFSLDITPTSASNKIMLFVDIAVSDMTSQANRQRIGLYRGSTAVAPNTDSVGSRSHVFEGSYTDEGNELRKMNLMFLDAPNTTSALNYNFKCTTDGGGTMYFNRSKNDNNALNIPRASSSITAFEIDSGVL